MKKNKKFRFIKLFIIVLLFTSVTSCKKPETKQNPIIFWATPLDICPGTSLSTSQLNATGNIDGDFIYTPPIGTVLSLGANQDLKVEFIPADVANYGIVSKTVKINVRPSVSSVIFNPDKTYGTMTDQEGNTYKTITIGAQTWMAENLRVTKYCNGDSIPNVTDTSIWRNLTSGAYCNYANTIDIDQIATYGRLYNWYTISDSRNIAPTGWHVPTKQEWATLTTFLGGVSMAGGKLKETGTTHWLDPNTSANNESGFSAVPGSAFAAEVFWDSGRYTWYWSSSAVDYYVIAAWTCPLYCDNAGCSPAGLNKHNGYSIRLVKD